VIVDYHMHTARCGHARGSVEEMVQAAARKGMQQVGIADHAPMLYADIPMLAMSPDELPGYVDEVLKAREKYRDLIEVRLGIEADYHAPTQAERQAMLEGYPFDYIIGSVHVLGDWIFDNPADVGRYDEIDLDEFYLEYIHTVRDMAESGFYNIVGHPDLVKKFDKRASIDLIPRYRELLEAVVRAGMCYEVNTAGFNVYRAPSEDGPWEKINQRLIPGSPDPLRGGSYVFTDTNVLAGVAYWYELEEVELGGRATRLERTTATAKGQGFGSLAGLPCTGGLSLLLVSGLGVVVAGRRRRPHELS